MIPYILHFVNVQPRRRGCTVFADATVQPNATRVFNFKRPGCSTGALYSIQPLEDIIHPQHLPSYRNGDRIPEFTLGNTVTVLFHLFNCYHGLTDEFYLYPCPTFLGLLVNAELQCLCCHRAHDIVFLAAVQLFNRNLCNECYLLCLVTHNIPQKMGEVQTNSD